MIWLRFPAGVISGEVRPKMVSVEDRDQVRWAVLRAVINFGIPIGNWRDVQLLDENLTVMGAVSYDGRIFDPVAYGASLAELRVALERMGPIPALAGATA